MGPALQHAGVQQTSNVGRLNRAVGHTALCSLDFDQGLQPQQAARAVAYQLHRQASRLALALQRLGHRIRAHGQGCGIARHIDARGSQCFIFDSFLRFICLGFRLFLLNFLQQSIESACRHLRMDFALVDHQGRRLGAQPQAVNRLQRHAAIGARAMGLAAQRRLRMGEQCIAATRLAGFGPADLDQRPAVRLLAQMRVIADNTMDLGTRKI